MNKSSIGTILALSLLAISKKGSKSNSEWSPQGRNQIDLDMQLNLTFTLDINSPRGTIEVIKERVEHAIQIFSKLIENPNDADPMKNENHIPFRDYPQISKYQSPYEHSFVNIEPQLFDEREENRRNTTVGEIDWRYENIDYDEDSINPNADEDEIPYDRIKVEWDAIIPVEIHYLPKKLKEIIDSEIWAEEFSKEISSILEEIIKDYFGPYYLEKVYCSTEVDLSEYEEPESWTRELERREPRTINALGLPWNTNTPLWHATVAYRKIMFLDGRFKTKQQLANQQVKNALGGDTGGGLSTTLDYRVACSVAIGLNVVRKIANKEITLEDLIKYAQQHDVLEETANIAKSLCNRVCSVEDAVEFLNGNIKIRKTLSGWAEILGRKGIPAQQVRYYLQNNTQMKKVQDGFGGETFYINRTFLKSFLGIEITEESMIQDSFMFYRSILKCKKFYDPLFFGTNPMEFKNINEEDIGIICATSSISRINTDNPIQIYNFGFTRNEQEARLIANACEIGTMWGADIYSKMNLSRDNEYLSIEKETNYANWQNATYKVDCTPIKMNKSNTMEIVSSMSEIRVYDLQKLELVTGPSRNINWGVFGNCYSMPISQIRYKDQPLNQMIAFPNFPDNDKEVLWPFNLNEKPKD